jgi:FdhD protein
MDSYVKRLVKRYNGDAFGEVEDNIAVERRLRLLVNGKEVMSICCTPLMIRELAVGLLMSGDVISGPWREDRMSVVCGEDIVVDVQAEGEARPAGTVITSGGAFPGRPSPRRLEDPFTIKAGRLKALFRAFLGMSGLHALTGCIHAACLCDGESVLCLAEDIGRHNAVDKVLGCALLKEMSFSGKMVLASGRLSSEIVAKCAGLGIPLVGSRGAPTSLALDTAARSGVTVVGFIRGDRLNVYTCKERVI